MKGVTFYTDNTVKIGKRRYTPGDASTARLIECHLATNPKQRGVAYPHPIKNVVRWFNWDGNREWMRPEYR